MKTPIGSGAKTRGKSSFSVSKNGMTAELGTIDNPIIEKAKYAGVEVFECYTKKPKGQLVMRRVRDDWINITQIFKLAKFSKAKRTRILESESKNIRHEKIQGGYGRFQGTWIALEDAKYIIEKYQLQNPVATKLVSFVEDPNNPIPLREKLHALKKQMKLNALEASNGYDKIVTSSSYEKKNSASNINGAYNREDGVPKSLSLETPLRFQQPMANSAEAHSNLNSNSKKRSIPQDHLQPHNENDDTESDRTITMECTTEERSTVASPYKRSKSNSQSPSKERENLHIQNGKLLKSSASKQNNSNGTNATTKPLQFFPYPTSNMKRFHQTPVVNKKAQPKNASTSTKKWMETPHGITHTELKAGNHSHILNSSTVNPSINSPLMTYQSRVTNITRDPDGGITSTPFVHPISVADYQHLLLNFLSSSNNASPQEEIVFPKELYFPPPDFNPNFILDGEGNSTLHWAVSMGNLSLVQFLLTNLKADPLVCNAKGFNCITKACFYNNCYKNQVFVDMLLCLAQCLISPDKNGRLPLHYLMELSVNMSKEQEVVSYYLDCALQVVSIPFPQSEISTNRFHSTRTNLAGPVTTKPGKDGKRKRQPSPSLNEKDNGGSGLDNTQNSHMMLNLLPTVLNYQDELGNTPLHVAALNMNFDLCSKLIAMGGNQDLLNFENSSVRDILHKAQFLLSNESTGPHSVPKSHFSKSPMQNSTEFYSSKHDHSTDLGQHPKIEFPEFNANEYQSSQLNNVTTGDFASGKFPSVYVSNGSNHRNDKLSFSNEMAPTNGYELKNKLGDPKVSVLEKHGNTYSGSNNVAYLDSVDEQLLGKSHHNELDGAADTGDLSTFGTHIVSPGLSGNAKENDSSNLAGFQRYPHHEISLISKEEEKEDKQLLPPSTPSKPTGMGATNNALYTGGGMSVQSNAMFTNVHKLNNMVTNFTNQLDEVYFRRQENRLASKKKLEEAEQKLQVYRQHARAFDNHRSEIAEQKTRLLAKRKELERFKLKYFNSIEKTQGLHFATAFVNMGDHLSDKPLSAQPTEKLEQKRQLITYSIKLSLAQLKRNKKIAEICTNKALLKNEKIFKYRKLIGKSVQNIDSKLDGIEKDLRKTEQISTVSFSMSQTKENV
ncbi:hypothetical protein ACO0QE_004227 [Hanseniaspora vineae]